jgi:hypothetical protein
MRTAPVTFGQLSVWRTQQTIPPDRWHESNLRRAWPLPPGTTVPALCRALTALAARHESLRTRYRLGERGGETQEVYPAPEVAVTVRAGTGDDEPARRAETLALAADLAATPIRLDEEFGWRAGVLTDGTGAPRQLALALHHIVADGWAIARLRSELLDSLTHQREPVPDGQPQPSRLGTEQHGPAWAKRRRAAIGYWARFLDSAGTPQAPPGPDDAGRIEARLVSPRGYRCLARFADVSGLPPAAVTLALTAVAVAAIAPPGHTALTLVSSNRYLPGWQRLVTSMNQHVPFYAAVAGPDEDFAAYARRLHGESLWAYRHSCYDVDEIAEYCRQRLGAPIVHDNYVNHMRREAAGSGQAPGIHEVRPRRSTGPRLYVKVFEGSTDLVVDIRVDPRLVPLSPLYRLLHWYEDGLVRLATGAPVRVGDLRDALGAGRF